MSKIILPLVSGRYPKELLVSTTRTYSSALSSVTKQIETGLSLEEIDRIFPSIINDTPNSTTFREKVQDWYSKLRINVPFDDGYTLNLETDEEGIPLNPTDYCIYKILLKDNTVIINPESDIIDSSYKYKVIDSEVIKNKEIAKFDIAKKGFTVLAKFCSLPETDTVLLRHIVLINKELLNMAVDEINNLSRIEIEMQLSNLNEKHPLKLIDAFKNKESLKLKGYIELFIAYSLITIEGEDYYLDGKKVAASKEGLQTVISNDSSMLSTLISKLKVEINVKNYFQEQKELEPVG
jgi:hypothetical protein